MVKNELPKYIKARVRNECDWQLSPTDLAANAPEPCVPTCMRCFYGIAKTGARYKKAVAVARAEGKVVTLDNVLRIINCVEHVEEKDTVFSATSQIADVDRQKRLQFEYLKESQVEMAKAIAAAIKTGWQGTASSSSFRAPVPPPQSRPDYAPRPAGPWWSWNWVLSVADRAFFGWTFGGWHHDMFAFTYSAEAQHLGSLHRGVI
ncbi:hypothetical protein LTR50_006986 [Elasticomyces elasticus]|nr:hypothetical protein LTR50_006986 [Elasticomyces elasticus]